jgi:hypothetical protein
MKQYIIVGDVNGDPNYGISMETYIFGIYQSESEANEILEKLKDSCEWFLIENCSSVLIQDSDGCIAECKITEVEDSDVIIQYNDFDYHIIVFEGRPIFCTSASYIE